MNRLLTALVGAISLTGLAAESASAQQVESPGRDGTTGAEHMLLPVTARSAALSTAFAGGLPGISALEGLQANPAALTSNTGTNAMFSRMEYVADIGVNYVGLAQRAGSNHFALTFTSWDLGEIQRVEESDPTPEVFETYDAPILMVGASYARQLTDRISAGLTTKLSNETIDNMQSTYVAFDAGMTYVVGESGLRFGVSLKNFGPQMAFGGTGLEVDIPLDENTEGVAGSIEAATQELPSLLNFGVSYTREFAQGLSASVLGNFRSNSSTSDQYSGALELGYQNIIFVRGGFELRDEMEMTFYEGWNVGGGINYDLAGLRVAVDYAYRPVQYFDGVNLFTASVTL
jgi:hypothetical protein